MINGLSKGRLRLCAGNTINYSDVTTWFMEMVQTYELTPAWVHYDSYSARYFRRRNELSGVQHGAVHKSNVL